MSERAEDLLSLFDRNLEDARLYRQSRPRMYPIGDRIRMVTQSLAARAAIAELIAACVERDEAEGLYGAAECLYGQESNARPMREARARMRKAVKRYCAALANVGGVK